MHWTLPELLAVPADVYDELVIWLKELADNKELHF